MPRAGDPPGHVEQPVAQALGFGAGEVAVKKEALRPGEQILSHVARELRVLVDHREDLVAERTRHINRLRWHLHELDPGWDPKSGSTQSGGSLAGWNWSQAFLPGGRALTVGVVKAAGGSTDGVAVLSGRRGRLGTARAARVGIAYRGWRRVGAFMYPPQMTVTARLGRWRTNLAYRARRPTPLPFDQAGTSALVEVLARVNGTLRGPGGRVIRVHDVPAFYGYQSTSASRKADGAPG